jgi:xanthine dehydrogenase accessory factor
MKLSLLEALEAARRQKRQVCLVRLLDQGGAEALVVDGVQTEGAPLADDVLQAARSALREDRSKSVDTGAGTAFLQVFNPPLRMIIVGAVHITQSLAPMAELAGYEVTVVDPRRAFATDARFPNTKVSQDWPDEALEALAPDRRTAVIALVHDPKLDDPALDVALRSDAFYIAALGSRRTHAARRQRLAALGHDDAAMDRIHGPAGLSLGAVSPAEIAIAVMAEMTQALRQPSQEPVADKAAPGEAA